MYERHQSPFTSHAKTVLRKNAVLIVDRADEDIKVITDLLDVEHRIATSFMWVIASDFLWDSELRKIHLSAFHKNLISLYATLNLTCDGLYGPARSLMRQVFEALLIAKFCSVSHDDTVLARWCAGEDIYLSNSILKKISTPDIQPFKQFWSILNAYSHATIYSQQIDIDVCDDMREVTLNFAFIIALLQCNYHLLNSHLIASDIAYYASRYGDISEVSDLRTTARSLFKKARKRLGVDSITLINAYKRQWAVT